MARCPVVNLLRFGNRVARSGFLRPLHAAAGCSSTEPRTGFKPDRVAVVTKTTRYEFELQRYRYAGLSEEDLTQLLAMKGSSYSGLLERHNIHTSNVEHIVQSLQSAGMEVRVVRRGEYDDEVVRWADAIVSAGGDGTMLLVASKVLNKDKPVVGVNTDPERSEGHLCLPVRYTRAFPEALERLCRGEFRWLWRQRLRLHLEGTGINPTPVDLHEQQLSLEQHNWAHRISTVEQQQRAGALHPAYSKPSLLPVRSLNEIFIGESLSSRAQLKVFTPRLFLHRASYYEISVDGGPWEKQKSSGLSVCTGTGSKAWSFNINKLAEQSVEEVLRIGMSQAGVDLPLSREFVGKVTDDYNASLVFAPDEPRLFYSVREPISNRVFSSSRQRGFASRVCVRSRCWDACMVVDGGTSFEFNDGAIATVTVSEEDRLRTVLLDQ
ncbi:NAD kinase 2, mitochondrial isoform X1 [Gambusia affinis]|uniref:NAD kinase 2, mitochondrial isoform X1 n=1 Tax=Gambusia affinis TaxID=33528 RepID=UPI001CDC3971|nr:NAD kinase 2, mitochondrial isoform X1 [Gambusia affinis]XP_044000750.1 NAD kinase 2, mitochondrial isoform X1 [Gambusia affinis]XP_044000752.1 NAD kinase 2, mitochondrial isoform X1 [Gambusia affinis]XP_044000753.1 NAD kinase 2, mitochondrial isoform X1 [Gambusia affinis]